MKIVAAIPARGGSVGLPGKNIRPLNGIPLVGRTVRAARGSRFISEVFVSSDSEEILSVARKYGAIGVLRPAELSGPTASSESALIHLLQGESSLISHPPDILVFLQCTAPFTLAHHIDQVIEALLTENATSAISVVDDHGFYWKIGEDGVGIGLNHDPSKPRVRRQDVSARYRENGAVYAMRVPEFLQTGNRYCGKTILVPMDATWIEIDTSQDWDMAEAFVKTEPFTGSINISDLAPIKAVVGGFDGVHTSNTVFLSSEGKEMITCNRSDELGAKLLAGRGIRMMIMESEEREVSVSRAHALGMEFKTCPLGKLEVLNNWRVQSGLDWKEIAYIGDQESDIPCLQACGLSVSPRSAPSEVKAISDIVLELGGGQGAFRELCDILIEKKLLAE